MCHHPDGSAPFSLLTYASARQHATQIAAATRSRYMPPWQSEPGYGDFVGHDPLTDAQIALIDRWVRDGAPEGEGPIPPPLKTWSDGWPLGQPDLVVTLPKAFELPADGGDRSRVFVMPVPSRGLRYVRGLAFRPGNPRAVHHANIRIDPTRASRALDEEDPRPGYDGVILRSAVYPDGHFLGWTPGQIAPLVPAALAWRLPPDTDLVVEVHMQPTGKPETVQPAIGLYFGDEPPTRSPAILRLGRQNIDIAPGDARYTVTDSFTLPVDVEVQAVQPHAHQRAVTVTGMATRPDGRTEWLIYIKRWDDRWQHVYRYVTPIALPKGTVLSMAYTYDNSEANPRNPDRPPVRVHWGQWAKDEMGDLWVQVLTRDEPDRRILVAAFQPKAAAEELVGYARMIAGDPTRVQLHDDAGVLALELGRASEAVRHFEASAALRPASAQAHYNVATARTLSGDLRGAVGEYEQAIRIRPDYPAAHNNLGSALLRLGRRDEALARFREAIRLRPDYAEAYYNLGSVSALAGRADEAIARWREALGLDPDLVPALTDAAWLLATSPGAATRGLQEAVGLGERAVALTAGRDAAALDALAAAFAAAGRFEEAGERARAALALTPDDRFAAAIQQREALYRRRVPYTAPAGTPRRLP